MVDLIWYQTATCAGDSVSFLNADQPSVFQIITELGVNIVFHPTIDPKTGREAMEILDPYVRGEKELGVLVVEGAVQRGPDGTGMYCIVGGKPARDTVLDLAKVAGYTVAIGTCASFGGVSAANPNPTDATGLQFYRDKKGGLLGAYYKSKAGLPVINIPGCPAHPDWASKTLGAVLLGKAEYIELDEYHRPKVFYGSLSHWGCKNNEYYEFGQKCEKFGDNGCLFKELGCKGPLTYSDCNMRLWNRQSSKTRSGSPCIGCTDPNFPDIHSGSFFRTKERFPTPVGASKLWHAAAAGFGRLSCPARLKSR